MPLQDPIQDGAGDAQNAIAAFVHSLRCTEIDDARLVRKYPGHFICADFKAVRKLRDGEKLVIHGTVPQSYRYKPPSTRKRLSRLR